MQPIFESAFREFGLPRVIRTDNGPPFATIGLAGLSRLAIWFIKLGVHPERTAPGKPTQNGRHERMHRTLGEDTLRPPARTFAQQQRRFDAFRRVFNEERPHEALGMQPPCAVYGDSPRRFPRKLVEPVYPATHSTRSVRTDGTIKLAGHMVFVSEALAGECVALDDEREDDLIAVFFGSLRLGAIHRATMKFDRTLTDE